MEQAESILQNSKDVDDALVERFKAGDMAAFNTIYDHYRRTVFFVCFGILTNNEDVQDAAQETFFNIFVKRGQFRGDSQLSTWIYRIALNVSLGYRRKRGFGVDHISIDDIQDFFSIRDRRLDRSVERIVAFKKIAGLSPEFQEIILLHEVDGLTLAEIARHTGLSLAACKKRLFRAKAKLHNGPSGKRAYNKKRPQ